MVEQIRSSGRVPTTEKPPELGKPNVVPLVRPVAKNGKTGNLPELLNRCRVPPQLLPLAGTRFLEHGQQPPTLPHPVKVLLPSYSRPSRPLDPLYSLAAILPRTPLVTVRTPLVPVALLVVPHVRVVVPVPVYTPVELLV